MARFQDWVTSLSLAALQCHTLIRDWVACYVGAGHYILWSTPPVALCLVRYTHSGLLMLIDALY